MKIEITRQTSEEVEVDIEFPLYLAWYSVGEYPGSAKDTLMRIDANGRAWEVQIPEANGDYDYIFGVRTIDLRAELSEYLDSMRYPGDRRKLYTWKRSNADDFYSALEKMKAALVAVPSRD